MTPSKPKPASKPSTPRFFASPAEFRAWLAAHHESASELLVGFHKVDSGRVSIAWPESVSVALCFGWIDGVRKRIDDDSYSIRFTPRKSSSIWSAINMKKMRALIADDLVHPAGLRAFERRKEKKSSVYAYENGNAAVLDPASAKEFKRNRAAWAFFESCPPWYRRTAAWRVVSAKRPETRAKRLAELIQCCAEGRSIPTLSISRGVGNNASRIRSPRLDDAGRPSR